MDLFHGASYDYVDQPYWSAMQLRVKQFALQNPNQILTQDLAKVLLFVNMTFDKGKADMTDSQLKDL
jgi:hypothetical protein